jgi:hypothetical protein
MKKMYKNTTLPSADELADMTDRGEDISRFFSNNGKIRYPAQKIGVDFTADMLRELDDVACEMNVGRLAIIKIFLRHALDQYYLARKERD